METEMNFSQYHWLNRPNKFQLDLRKLTIVTDPETDFWQQTYYGFRHDNAHAFYRSIEETEFTFTVKVDWRPVNLFDQCGVVIYQDADNWFKAGVEYYNVVYSRLGCVVTNLGFSDWSTTDIDSARNTMHYRLSRRGQDFLIENSDDGNDFMQMRIFHMHQPIEQTNIGVYACSPLKSSMQVVFSDFLFGDCLWKLAIDI